MGKRRRYRRIIYSPGASRNRTVAKIGEFFETYKLKEQGEEILAGLSIGEAIASGKVCRVQSSKDIDKVKDNSILVTEMTDPDWVPIMKRVATTSRGNWFSQDGIYY